MTSFIHYHDAEDLKYLPMDWRPARPVMLKGESRPARGDTVFLITGVGTPRRYYLWERYTIQRTRQKAAGFFVIADNTQAYDPPRRLDEGRSPSLLQVPVLTADDFFPLHSFPLRSAVERAIHGSDGDEVEADAEEIWSEIIALRPKDGDAFVGRALARKRAGQFEGSSDDFERWLDLGTLVPQPKRRLEGWGPGGAGTKAGGGNGSGPDVVAIQKIIASAGRQGQGKFRKNVLEAYGSRCALTECSVGEVLSAAHIIDHHVNKSQKITNGILLRADIHLLFDRQLLRIWPDTLTVVIDKKLEDTGYKGLAGAVMRKPAAKANHPSRDALRWRWDTANRTPGLSKFEPPNALPPPSGSH